MESEKVFTTAPSPESVGIPSQAILNFLQGIDSERINMHGFLLVRHNKIAAEGYWAPWSVDRKHRMYSVSKSFVSLAVGMMVDEGKLSLDDRVVDYFPDKLPEKLHPWLAASTVRDLLTMSTAHSRTSYTRDDPDWVWTFFNRAPSHPPGTIFSYDTAATVVLTATVERLAGMPFLEYMRPRFLDRIGFSTDAWSVRTPEGGSWGGSGVICTLRDLAKVALACMNGGMWGEERVLPEAYVSAATAKQIDNAIRGNCGYGYQIWCDEENGFSFRGMGSQYAICFPDKAFQFTCIADTQGAPSGSAIPAVMREEIYPHLSDTPLPENPDAYAELSDKIAQLAVLPIPGNSDARAASEVDGAWYALEENPMGITRMRLSFKGDLGTWEYTNGQGDNVLPFGIGHLLSGKFPQRNYFGEQIGTVSGREYDCLASAAWIDEKTLNMEVYITDIHLGGLRVSFAFKGEEIGVFMTKQAEFFLDEYNGFAGGKRL
ncbi:MAG: CubicO group peptidase (beta-lactamase class C family) [Candidatus Latescibacterota bacterium]|jgi:CubicO group peptidase (beta-lactamase class C family)